MALEQTHSPTMAAPQRRLVFGFNVVLQAVLVIVVVVAAIWITGRFTAQADLTSTGRNSLSSRTLKLLAGLDQDVHITAVFAEPDKRDELGQKRRRQLQDLLSLYDNAGGARVSADLVDPSLNKKDTDALLQRLQELPAYKDETQPHQQVLAQFATLDQQLGQLANAESTQADELAKTDPKLSKDRNFAIVRANLRSIAQESQEILQKLEDLRQGEIPRYGQAVKEVRDYVTSSEAALRDTLAWMQTQAQQAELSDPARAYFAGAAERFQPVLTELKSLLELAKDLKEVKIEELYTGLTRWRTAPPVLVYNQREARLVPFWDLWPPQEQGAPLTPDGDDRVFAGETAISSALLQLTQKDKTAVIFTRFGGEPLLTPDFRQMNPMMMQQMPRAPFQELNQLLEKANFVTAEWDVATQKTPPEVEGASRRVYVVFPTEPPPPPDPRQPAPPPSMTPEDRKLVLDEVEKAGLGVFLAGWTPPPSPMMGAAGVYDYGEYLAGTWGVEVENNYLTLQFMPHPEKPGQWIPAGRQPQLITTDEAVEFTDHPIGAPLKSDRAGFVLVAPLKQPQATSVPAGVTQAVVAAVRKSGDVWATANIQELEQQLKATQSVRPGADAIPAPFPIVIAATRQAGDSEQRLVVFGSEHFLADAVAQASGLQQRGNSLVLGPLYAANSDLLINALHWLTGEQDRIAVGPRTGELPRLSRLDEAWTNRLPWLLVGFWPALAIVVGLGVWLVRRK